MTQTSALDALCDETAAHYRRGLEPVVVFDLDDTLLSTAHRHVRILKEFAGAHPAHAKLGALTPAQMKYQIVDTARAAGVDDHDALKALRAFWFQRFFKNDYLSADEPIPGGAGYCRALAEKGALLVYMTGRDETMRAGTLDSLKRHAFPMPDEKRVKLILKPRFEDVDLEFKTAAMETLAAWGDVLGAFENEPLHVNMFGDRFEAARLFLLETRHSGKPVEARPAAHRIKDFVRG